MWIPDAAVQSFLDNVSLMLARDEMAIVREDLEKLQTELMKLRVGIHNFLTYNHIDGDIFKEIRDILGAAEDSVDYAYLRILAHSGRSRSGLGWIPADSKTTILMEGATYRVQWLNIDITNNDFEVLQYSEMKKRFQHEEFAQLDRATAVAKVEEEGVIGFDGVAKNVADLLTTGAEHLEVISIVGMLGLGKTTLAKKVFKDPDVDYEYKIRAFVYVSSGYDKREVLLKILTCFTQINDEVSDEINEEHLEKYVYQLLQGKQYLVVLDDVRDPEDWDRIKGAFPNSTDKRSRVLITTRNEAVAKVANPRNPNSLYKLNFLRLESSRELFRWKVFGENYCPMELKEYEEDIVWKCDGLPLALVAVASIIMKHPNRVDWWKAVASSLKDYIARDVELATIPIKQAYEHLPNPLKPCFLYLAAFPENFEIPVWKLLRLWIAEGFIQQKEGGSLNLEDFAEQYVELLVDRNLVMVSRMRSNGRIGKCVMNGILYDFCKKEAAKENLFLEMYNVPPTNSSQHLCRRLCINKVNILDYLSTKPSGKTTRTFLNFSRRKTKVKPRKISGILNRFRLLVVLEVQSLLFTVFPNKFFSLVFLKYLSITGRIKVLPSTLSNLRHLITLIVETTSCTLKIKVDVWKMPRFRHLHTNSAASFPCPANPKIQKTEDDEYVQTLCYISPGSLKKEGFDQTTKLKKLGIRGRLSELFEANGTESRLLSYFQKLEWLENLKLLNEDTISSKFPGLPPRGNFPKKLAKLTLSNTRNDWKEMHTLGELENLEVLKLKEYAFVGEQWKTERGGFLRLKHLHIGRTDLMVWEASSDHFPELKSLEINECDQLQRIPHGLADISSLQSVHLHRSTSPGVTYSLKRIRLVKFLQAKEADKRKIFEISVFPPQE